jgi:hypothetical protein
LAALGLRQVTTIAYDAVRDAFIAPEPEGNLGFDEATCQWIMPEIDEPIS